MSYNIMVRGVEVISTKTSNSKFDFYLDELSFFKTDMLEHIPLGEFVMEENRFLGNKEGVFKCFAQHYGRFRFCIIATKEEQTTIKEILSKIDHSIHFVEFFDEIPEIDKNDKLASIVYFPNINMLNKKQETEELEIFSNEQYMLGRYSVNIIQAKEATDEFFQNFIREGLLKQSQVDN